MLLAAGSCGIMVEELNERANMAWLFGRKKKKKRAPRRLPKRVLAPVPEIVEQGLLVADVAVRMTVKNAIIMNALKEHADFDKEQIIGMVRNTVEELAAERERDARHIARVRGEIRAHGNSAWQETEYGNSDSRTLKHRQEVYEGVAAELRDLTSNQEYLRKSAKRAHELAWEEIGNSLKDRAMHPYYSGGHDAEYRENREARIQDLIENELQALVKSQEPEPEPRSILKGRAKRKAAKED